MPWVHVVVTRMAKYVIAFKLLWSYVVNKSQLEQKSYVFLFTQT